MARRPGSCADLSSACDGTVWLVSGDDARADVSGPVSFARVRRCGRWRRSRGLDMRSADAWSRYLVVLAGVSVAYLGAAKFGLSLAFGTKQVSAVWPPTG